MSTNDSTATTEGPEANFGPPYGEENVALGGRSSNTDTGKIVRSGVPSSTFWHFADFRTHGIFVRTETLPTSQVNSFSQVAVSITELGSDGNPFLGNAHMAVLNVVPHFGGRLIVRGNVAWNTDLPVRLNYIIVN
jgi:hypothetical protein